MWSSTLFLGFSPLERSYISCEVYILRFLSLHELNQDME
jgi:hypothetical protein